MRSRTNTGFVTTESIGGALRAALSGVLRHLGERRSCSATVPVLALAV